MTATRAAIASMMKHNGLPASAIPQTIEDAMSICSRLGFDYLWVDRVCIVQDDQEDQMRQITAMGDIYSLASLVLIAAYGDNTDFGIPGVSRPRSRVQRHIKVAGLQVTNIVQDPLEDKLAMWSTRGWTYQEAVLARRRLYFTNRRAFYECGTSSCHEDAYNIGTQLSQYESYRFLEEREHSRFETFVRHLEYYSPRNLSYRADVYHAFTGIMKTLYGRDSRFIDGLPELDFDRALRWHVSREKQSLSRVESSEVLCPSWSWSSAMGHTIFHNRTELYGSLTLWYRIEPASLYSTEEIKSVNFHPETEMDDDWRICMAIACEEGCLPNRNWDWSLADDSFLTIRRKVATCWSNYHDFCKDALQLPKPTKLPGCFEGFESLVRESKLGIITGSTQSAFLRLGPSSVGVDIYSHTGDFIGEIFGKAVFLREMISSTNHGKERLYEFIALSVSGLSAMNDFDEAEENNYFDMNGEPLGKLPIVNLCMIERIGTYACRNQLGWVYLKQWAKIERQWKIVRLG